jgi:methylthioribose-1-phosphate isomerase
VEILDQTRLPREEVWLDGSDPDHMIQHIKALSVRGAPLIGVAAAFSLGCFAQRGHGETAIRSAARRLVDARPTAVNLRYAIERQLLAFDRSGPDAIMREAIAQFQEDVELCENMAQRGAALIHEGEGILTHCNSGGLATAGVGTALGVLIRAHQLGRGIQVFVDETRPLLQGGRLTAWELSRHGVPFTLITDSMAPVLMRQGRIQRVMLGADRVAMNGDFANKIGTYGVAVAAAYHGVPFHPVAPRSTVDPHCATGDDIPIEEREAHEVRGAHGGFGSLSWAPADAPVFNPAFDVTPASLITSMVLDNGVLSREALAAGALRNLLDQPGTHRRESVHV